MATTYTVDASVFLNAFNRYEAGHEQSNRLLRQMQDEAVPIIVPGLLLPEVAAAVARGRDDADLARGFAVQLSRLPHLILVPVDDRLAKQAADIAAQHRLRGADAVYASVALRFGSTLVTLDEEQRQRIGQVIPTRLPAEALSEWA
ncbi:MAG: type II toxin-antitoxin system VapC family toxin [Anaerolineae bacterium]